ncbi:hypothetical protein JTB14_023396 [Gonioctena quinquepunctata]|nr:hypothetical protein JTB14_023396 [Gonioctena quinquepunctata]
MDMFCLQSCHKNSRQCPSDPLAPCASEDNPADPASRGLLPSEPLPIPCGGRGHLAKRARGRLASAILQSSHFFDTKEETKKNVCIAMVQTEPLQKLLEKFLIFIQNQTNSIVMFYVLFIIF